PPSPLSLFSVAFAGILPATYLRPPTDDHLTTNIIPSPSPLRSTPRLLPPTAATNIIITITPANSRRSSPSSPHLRNYINIIIPSPPPTTTAAAATIATSPPYAITT
nr:hypothetical protein [Tanacetum cinerariifolium]